jgi:hypothetical protein
MKIFSVKKFTLFLAAMFVVMAATSANSPEISAEKFQQCHSKNPKQIISTLKQFSINRTKDGQKISCKPGVDGFNENGHKPDYSHWDAKHKRCVLVKKFCFIGQEWASIHHIKSDGQILQEEYKKVYQGERSLILTKRMKK